MDPRAVGLQWTELDRTTWPEFRERIEQAEAEAAANEPRTYPGYPTWPLPRVRQRRWRRLDAALLERRSDRQLAVTLPAAEVVARLLSLSHGVHAPHGRGPTPSAGGLQALELYLVNFANGWLPAGVYHYGRAAHLLAQLSADADRAAWRERVPSLHQIDGGSLLWLLVGDTARVEAKYGARGHRFLLLEAGHLMQNLCLVSASLGLSTVPLGGFLEREIARELCLAETDLVLYTGAAGSAA